MRTALTQADLDQAACSHPGCTNHGADEHGIAISSRCHPKAGARVSYALGVLTVTCRICKALIVRIAVAAPPAAEAS